MNFPKRLFYGQNIIPENRKLGYVWIGRALRGGGDKTVRWGHPDGKGGWVEKEYKYKYGKKHLAGGINWADLTIRKFAKLDKNGNIVYRNGDMVRGYTLDVERYQRGNKAGQPKLDKHGNYIPINPRDYARVENEMFIEVTPNWQAALVKVRREYVHRWNGKGKSVAHRTRRTVEDSVYSKTKRNKFYLNKVFTKRQFGLSVRVGFLHPDEPHGTWGGHKKLINYRSLIAALMFRGYDPLMPLRDMAYINKIRTAMGRECGEALNNGRPFEPILRKYGKEMEGYVYEYIIGGIKPSLDKTTITIRQSRKNAGYADYPAGIEEPLVETGELANEVSYDIKQNDLDDSEVDEYEEMEQLKKTPVVNKEKKALERLAADFENEADARAKLIAMRQAQAMDDWIDAMAEENNGDWL